jgi:hypothetical protein
LIGEGYKKGGSRRDIRILLAAFPKQLGHYGPCAHTKSKADGLDNRHQRQEIIDSRRPIIDVAYAYLRHK